MTLNKTLFWLCYGLLCLNQAASGEPSCQLTTRERCSFGSSGGACVSNDNATKFPEYENDDGHYHCKVNQAYWARCDKGCFDEGVPMQFENDEDPMTVMCKTVPMKCQFPFTFKGKTYHECTNDLIDDNEYDSSDEQEQFLWCATQVEDDGTMVDERWGVCDLNSCENDSTEQAIDNGNEALVQPITAEVNILAESNSAQISATISFRQDSPDAPLRIEGHISGLPQGQHGFHVHQNGDTSDQCMAAGPHFNPTQAEHGSQISDSRHAGDFGNIEADADGQAEVDITLTGGSSTLFGQDSLLSRTLVIHADKDDLGKGGDAGSLATGNAGARLACGLIEPKEAPTQSDLAKIIIIVLVVIIVLLILLIAALLVYCCKKKRQICQGSGKGEEGVPFQNGDMKKKPLAYDELSIPFIDASPTPTPKVGRSTERLSFFNRTPSIGRSRGSLSKEPADEAPTA